MNNKVNFLFFIFLLVTGYRLLVTDAAHAALSANAGKLIINEISFTDGTNDWVELYVVDGSVNWTGYILVEDTSTVATIPAAVGAGVATGDYIVIHEEAGSNDTVMSDNNAGYWDVYAAGDFYATDNIIQIKESGGARVDALLYSNNGGAGGWTRNNAEADAVVSDGLWDATADFSIAGGDDDSDAWVDSDDVGTNQTLGRDSSHTNNNVRADWSHFTTATPGETNPVTGTSGDILINEIAPSVSGSKDWIEFRNVSGSSKNIQYWTVKERTTTVKTFPSYSMSADEYIVLHFDNSTSDETSSDTNGNGYRDFYTSDGGLTGTDNVITFYDAASTIIDALAFSNRDGTWAPAQQTAFNTIVNGSEWTGTVGGGAATNEAESADWSSGSSSKSLGRDNASGITDDDDKDDWRLITSPTKGEVNPSSLDSDVRIKINEVSFAASSSRDWVELYCVDDGNSGGGVDISDCFFEDDGTIKTIAKGTTIKTGEYLVLQPASGAMTVTFLDVGAGDSILVQTPGNKRMLIDGGRSWAGEDNVLPYLDEQGISTIHLMVATHADADHYQGLEEVLDNKTVNEVWLSGSSESASGYVDFIAKVDAESGCTKTNPSVGTTYTLDSDYNVTVTVLNNYASRPTGGGDNASSLVIHLKYGNVSFMLTGDAESSTLSGDARDGVEEALVSAHGIGLTSDILKVGHHGSANATSNDFLTYVYPDKAIISVGAGSSAYGHPTAAALNRLTAKGIPYYPTGSVSDQPSLTSYGNIEIFTNGMSYWMDELSAGSDGIINIFAHSTALTSTDEQVIFKDGLGNIEDAVCWSDGALPSAEQIDLTAVYNAGEWSGDSASDCVDSTAVSTNYSIARNSTSSDTNTKSDWSVSSSPTRGKNSGADMPSGVGISGMGVSEDPFLSDGSDLGRRYTSISFTLNKESEVTIQALNSQGRVVRTLGEDKYYIADSFAAKWDGKNGSGDSVPIGYYTIYVKAVAEDGSSSTEATTTVTVAKSLSEGGAGGCFIATAAYTPQSGANPKSEIRNPKPSTVLQCKTTREGRQFPLRNSQNSQDQSPGNRFLRFLGANSNYQMVSVPPGQVGSYGTGEITQTERMQNDTRIHTNTRDEGRPFASLAKTIDDATSSSFIPRPSSFIPHPSSLVPQLKILRRFRDEHLLTNPLGRAFVSTYGKISPPIAGFVSDKEVLKAITRSYLKPVVWVAKRILK